MSGEAFVSVVTPVHNGAEHLEGCIQSVLAQTHANWHLTIVDNASSDATSEIAAAYASREDRIRHLRFETLVGAAANHNRAFRAAERESEFCKVVQADDRLAPSCLAEMVRVAGSAEEIGVVSAYRRSGAKVDLVGLPFDTTVAKGHEILRQSLLGGPYVTGSPSALLLRTSLLERRDPFYQPTYWHADTEAAYWVLTQCDLGFVHQVLTFSRRDPGSRTGWADRVNTYGPEGIRFLLAYGPKALDEATYRKRLRFELRRYVWYHTRQLARAGRARDHDFLALHRAETRRMLQESGGDVEVKAAVAAVRALLLRGGLDARSEKVDELFEIDR